ncbi:MAG TPA: ATP-binding protein, partial [Vicinamibacteria bacterium]|nr:ATP-binding protein [Vicinamibacteria bacterium]
SPALTRVLGYQPEELNGVDALSLVHPDDVPRARGHLADAVAHPGRVAEATVRFRSKTGKWVAVEGRVVNRLDDPDIGAIVVNYRDVTERRRAEALQSALYRIAETAATADSLDALFSGMHSIVGELTYAGNFYIALLDEKSATLSFPYFVDEHDPPPAPIPVGRTLTGYVIRTGRPLLASPEVFQGLLARGEVEWVGGPSVDWLGVPLAQGSTVFGALVVQSYREDIRFGEPDVELLTFVSRHIGAAIARWRGQDRLKSTVSLLQSTLESTGDGILVLSLDRQSITYNRRFAEMWGLPAGPRLAAEAIIRHASALVAEPERFLARIDEMFAAPEGDFSDVIHLEDGRVFERYSTAQRLDGRAVGRVCSFRDVTEKVRAEHEVVRQRDALHQGEKMAALGTVLAGVAHELNNPLAVVLGHAGLLRAASQGAVATRADKIMQAAERCRRIVDDFLALARQRPPELRPVRVNDAVREAVSESADRERSDDVVEMRLAGGLPPILGDRHQVHQVVVNLLSNAHQAVRSAGRPGRITVTTGRAGAGVWLEVADNGPGIPPEVRSRVFDPFFTTKAPGGGTGLGLALCERIVKGHGGTIAAGEAADGGAVFHVEFPAAEPEPKPAGAPAAPETARGLSILIVDDDVQVADVLADLLAEDGHQVDAVRSGQEALARLEARDYDVVLSDIRMPGLDGPGLFREVKARRPALARRFIFLTGDSFSPQTAAFLAEAHAPSLNKPFGVEALRATLREVVGR